MSVRILHTADLQIGRIYAQFEPDDAAALFEARFQAVERLARLAAQQHVDAVLVAGDVFDAQTVSDKTLRRFANAMQAYDGPWMLLPGNHDAALAESVWTRAGRIEAFPPNVVACLEPCVRIVADKFALLPAPLTQRHTYADLTEWFATAETPEGVPRIGLAHGCVQGVLSDDVDSANPVAWGRAATARLDYLALGDWHGTRRIDDRTWYAGTLETDRFKANDSGQALLVEVSHPGALPRVEALRIGRYRWTLLEPRLAVTSDLEEVLRALETFGPDDVVELRMSGVCDLHAQRRLRHGLDAARARLRALVHEAQALVLEPTQEDLDAMHADGYVGDVLQTLRAEQSGPNARRARDALVILARMLGDPAKLPERTA